LAGVLLLVALGIAFAFRHREWTALQQENAALLAEMEVRALLNASNASVDSKANGEASMALSSTERIELMRLKGEIQPLRDELRAHEKPPASASPRQESQVAHSGRRVPGGHPEVRAILTGPEFSDAGLLAQRMMHYLEANGGELPRNWQGLIREPDARSLEGVADRFELMRTNTVPADARAFTLVAREKEPRQLTDGQWVRGYLLANGGVALAGPVPEPDWPGWERMHEARGREAARRRATSAP